MPYTANISSIPRSYLPGNFKVTDWQALEPYFKELEERPLNTREDLESWLKDLSELEAVVSEDAAWRQIRENRTDACVLNGAAYGSGFAFCEDPQRNRILECGDKSALVKFLAQWLRERLAEGNAATRQ